MVGHTSPRRGVTGARCRNHLLRSKSGGGNVSNILGLALALLAVLGSAPNPKDFCRNIVLDLPLIADVKAARVMRLHQNQNLVLLGQWGSDAVGIIDLSEHPTIAHSMRFRQPSWLHSDSAQSQLVIPAIVDANVVGVCILEIRDPRTGDDEELNLLEAGVEAFFTQLLRKEHKSNGDRLLQDPNVAWMLTERQRVILAALPSGETNREIASALHVSESLIKQELVRIYRIIGANSRLDAAAFASTARLHTEPH